jgi:2-phosphosulfolactate phosphatase
MTTLEVLFAPAEFSALNQRDLSETVCVVFDVLRATSSMATALANGAEAIIPVADIPEALAIRDARPEVLLAGERNGVRIQANLTGSISFDLGNSPREFTPELVRGRAIVMTTTNGTRALRACAGARAVLACCFLNLRATADFVLHLGPQHLLLVCSGTVEEAAYEDALGAGAFCDLSWHQFASENIADSAGMARRLFHLAHKDLFSAFSASRNGKRLLARADLKEDVSFCAQVDRLQLVAELKEGEIRKQTSDGTIAQSAVK